LKFQSADVGFKFQESGFKQAITQHFSCLEGSTERSDGSLGRSLRTVAMVAWEAVSGWYCMVYNS
jgi:hypothetical protein